MHRETQAVKTLIHNAAASESTVSFTALFAIFPKNTVPGDVYRILEDACFELGNWSEVIYSVVMAKKDTNLPGDGFFDIFKNHRNLEYLQIAGGTNIQNLTLEQKIKMVKLEKIRVYASADLHQQVARAQGFRYACPWIRLFEGETGTQHVR